MKAIIISILSIVVVLLIAFFGQEKVKVRVNIYCKNCQDFEWHPYSNDGFEHSKKLSGEIYVDTTMYMNKGDRIGVFFKIKDCPECKLEDYIRIYQNDSLRANIYGLIDYSLGYQVK